MQTSITVVVLSHLRWDFVFQRPQHLLSRLAKTYPVFFVEEPVAASSLHAEWQFSTPDHNITVCRPQTPAKVPGFSPEQHPYLKVLMSELLERQGISNFILWFYSPMAVLMTEDLKPQLVVYDCMDELSAFSGAAPELRAYEEQLLQQADLVFTGGPSLYRAKKDRHDLVYCFPSSVDAVHFNQARTAQEPADQASLPHPRLGFFGVIDERMDLGLLQHVAKVHPEWQIVMVGPVVKIDPATLPQESNIHYLGQRSYAQLPPYLSGWDVCLLPFARNKSTEYISPTKTLEYMAAHKLIVSTPIRDVAEPYREIVHLGGTAAEFTEACERALAADDKERARRQALMDGVLRQTSWASTVSRMKELIESALESKHCAPAMKAVKGAGKPASI